MGREICTRSIRWKEVGTMGSFGLDVGVGIDLFLRWLAVMFGLDIGIS